MSRLIDIASAEIGTEEIAGAEHNPRILEYAREAGFDWVNSDETPWCSIFLNWVAHKAGYERTKDGRARSWSQIGEAVQEPQPGDIILVGTNGNPEKVYHVGIFTGFSSDGQQVFCLGGNQTNRVSITRYWRKNVAAFRRLEQIEVPLDRTETPPPTSPQPPSPEPEQPLPQNPPPRQPRVSETPEAVVAEGVVRLVKTIFTNRRLQYGSRGESVRQLQQALNQLGFSAGVADGIFGRQTENALRDFQRSERLRPNGKLTRRTRKALEKRLDS